MTNREMFKGGEGTIDWEAFINNTQKGQIQELIKSGIRDKNVLLERMIQKKRRTPEQIEATKHAIDHYLSLDPEFLE